MGFRMPGFESFGFRVWDERAVESLGPVGLILHRLYRSDFGVLYTVAVKICWVLDG